MVWCQQVCGFYLQQSGNPALMGERLTQHASGARLGGTGMSNPMKAYAGIEPLLLKATPVAGGYRVSGTLPWVSNLGDDHYAGLLAGVDDGNGLTKEVMFLLPCDAPGCGAAQLPVVLGHGGHQHLGHPPATTCSSAGTWSSPTRPSPPSPASAPASSCCRPALAWAWPRAPLMRCGLWSRHSAMSTASWTTGRTSCRPSWDALSQRIQQLCLTPFASDTDYLIDVLDVRAHASELALRAAQSSLMHAGARGYLLSSEVQRRVRESHFVAIVSPAIKHLRKEIARLSTPEMPA